MGLDMFMYTASHELCERVAKWGKETGYMNEYDIEDCLKRGMIGYWRKFSALHHYFIETVQNGNDDCGLYEIEDYSIIMTAYRQLKKALETRDINDFHPVPGFFFNIDDEWHWNQVKRTKDFFGFLLDNIVEEDGNMYLLNAREPDWDIRLQYASSW